MRQKMNEPEPPVSRTMVPSSPCSVWMLDTDRLEELGMAIRNVESSPSKDGRPTKDLVSINKRYDAIT